MKYILIIFLSLGLLLTSCGSSTRYSISSKGVRSSYNIRNYTWSKSYLIPVPEQYYLVLQRFSDLEILYVDKEVYDHMNIGDGYYK